MPNLNQHIEWIKRTGNEDIFREKYVKNMLQLDYRLISKISRQNIRLGRLRTQVSKENTQLRLQGDYY